MKVLLVQPPLEDFYTTPIRLYPLGLLYAARVLEEAGAEVQVLDCLSPPRKRRIPVPRSFGYLPQLDRIPYFFKGYHRFGIKDEEILRRIKAFSPDVIGISSQFTAYYESVESLARLIKGNFSRPVFIGGNHATVFASEVRRRTPEIDFVLEGPAERCLPGFLEHIDRRKGEWRENTNSEAQVEWRTIRPSHHLLRGIDYRIGRKNYVSLGASRGCPYACEFCSVHRMFGRKIEYREVGSVLAEMRDNYDRKEVRVFNFEDDNLSFNRTWFLEFLRAVASETEFSGVELTAMNGLCYNTLDGTVLEAMKRAGFRELNLSLVTGSLDLQQSYGRPYQIDNNDKLNSLIRQARRLSFFITVYIILGLPGQSYAEVKETIDYLLSLDVLVGPSVFYLAPGSSLYDRLTLPPAVKEDWNLYRSSAFAMETPDLSRAQLLKLFSYVRQKNLERKGKHPNS